MVREEKRKHDELQMKVELELEKNKV